MFQLIAMPWAIPTIFGCLVAIVAIVAKTTSATLQANAETNLKKRMIEQGYTVAEIERVIHATARNGQPFSPMLPADTMPLKPPKQHAM